MKPFWTQLSLENSSDTLPVMTILSTLEHSTYSRSLEVWNCGSVARRALSSDCWPMILSMMSKRMIDIMMLTFSKYSDASELLELLAVMLNSLNPPKYDKGRPREPHTVKHRILATIKQRASAAPKYDKAPPKYDKGRAREVLLWMNYLEPLIIYSARTQPGNHFE